MAKSSDLVGKGMTNLKKKKNTKERTEHRLIDPGLHERDSGSTLGEFGERISDFMSSTFWSKH